MLGTIIEGYSTLVGSLDSMSCLSQHSPSHDFCHTDYTTIDQLLRLLEFRLFTVLHDVCFIVRS